MNFPKFSDWVEETTFKTLHEEHEDWQKVNDEKIDFDTFVKNQYEIEQDMFHDDMVAMRRKPKIEFDMEGEVDVESAKIVLARIIEKGVRKGLIEQTIDKENLAPDHNCARHILDAFWDVVLPAVEENLGQVLS